MWFALLLCLLYLISLACGMVFPLLGRLGGVGGGWLGSPLYLGAGLGALGLASLVVTLLIAQGMFPRAWWLSHVLGKDIYLHGENYFIGSRSTRQQSRLSRLLLGMNPAMRRWHLLFTVLLCSLLFIHTVGASAFWRYSLPYVPPRPVIRETLHASTLNALPVLKSWGAQWRVDPAFARRVRRALAEDIAKNADSAKPAHWFNSAQLHLLNAFEIHDPERGTGQATTQRLRFDHHQAKRALTHLQRILARSPSEQGGLGAHALVLSGFVHLSRQDAEQALTFFKEALSLKTDSASLGLPRHQVMLLAAQAALLAGEPAHAESFLEPLLTVPGLPEYSYGQTVEHFAAVLHLQGENEQGENGQRGNGQGENEQRGNEQGNIQRGNDLLNRALEIYRKHQDRSGIARVHLRWAALALEQQHLREASHELSLAASLAHGLKDGFTLNMVEELSLYFPRIL